MTTHQIADRLVALCREGRYETAQVELYAADATSHEPYATPDFPQETKGRDGIIGKGRQFTALIEKLHANEVSDPLVAGNSFACRMRIDATMKGKGRMDMTELCVYDVKDGKIVAERFHV